LVISRRSGLVSAGYAHGTMQLNTHGRSARHHERSARCPYDLSRAQSRWGRSVARLPAAFGDGRKGLPV